MPVVSGTPWLAIDMMHRYTVRSQAWSAQTNSRQHLVSLAMLAERWHRLPLRHRAIRNQLSRRAAMAAVIVAVMVAAMAAAVMAVIMMQQQSP